MQAAFKGCREIAFAIVAMSLTLAACYVPVRVLDGPDRQSCSSNLPSPSRARLVSGFTALTLSPMMSSRMLRPAHEHGRFYLAGERVLAWMDSHYKARCAGVMAMRWWVVGGASSLGGLRCCSSPAQGTRAAGRPGPGDRLRHRARGRDHRLHRQVRARDGDAFRTVPEMNRFFEIVGFNGVTSAIGFVGLKDWSER
jgi:multidrug efflux pump